MEPIISDLYFSTYFDSISDSLFKRKFDVSWSQLFWIEILELVLVWYQTPCARVSWSQLFWFSIFNLVWFYIRFLVQKKIRLELYKDFLFSIFQLILIWLYFSIDIVQQKVWTWFFIQYFCSWQMLWCLPFSVPEVFRVSSELKAESEGFSEIQFCEFA